MYGRGVKSAALRRYDAVETELCRLLGDRRGGWQPKDGLKASATSWLRMTTAAGMSGATESMLPDLQHER